MAGKPLTLNWKQLLSENDVSFPPLELELVPCLPPASSSTSVPESFSSSIVQQFTDYELEDKMIRLNNILKSDIRKTLPDDGRKLYVNLRAMREESERRKLARNHKAAEKCPTDTELRPGETCVFPINSLNCIAMPECDSRTLFTSRFNKKLDEKAVSISKIHGSMNPRQSPRISRVSSRKENFSSYSKAVIRTKKSFNAISNTIKPFKFCGQCIGRSSKRLKSSKEMANLIQRSRNANAVVLLDEEGIQLDDSTSCASDNRKEGMMYYPSRNHPESVELFYSDLKCLEPEQYISSPIMNFYIRYLQSSPSSVNKFKGEYFFFNTYFFGKLVNALLSEGDGYLEFSKLRRWWKGVNIFEKAYIFLPIHKDLHWSLIIISIPSKEDDLNPIILHLDSLGMHNSFQIFEVIECFLTKEWDHTDQKLSSQQISSADNVYIDKKVVKVPQQKNEYDCGLFVLYFMERFIDEAPLSLKRLDLGMFGSKWFRSEDASGLRRRIKNLLLEEFESSMLENGQHCPESPGSEV